MAKLELIHSGACETDAALAWLWRHGYITRAQWRALAGVLPDSLPCGSEVWQRTRRGVTRIDIGDGRRVVVSTRSRVTVDGVPVTIMTACADLSCERDLGHWLERLRIDRRITPNQFIALRRALSSRLPGRVTLTQAIAKQLMTVEINGETFRVNHRAKVS